jgi:hypothetical protein
MSQPDAVKSCVNCKFAVWKLTKSGQKHPDKSGRCAFVWQPPPLPKAFKFSWGAPGELKQPSGGFITRDEHAYRNCDTHEVK